VAAKVVQALLDLIVGATPELLTPEEVAVLADMILETV
jgi:hypothetical protein